jgi:ribosome biogenesis GTPase
MRLLVVAFACTLIVVNGWWMPSLSSSSSVRLVSALDATRKRVARPESWQMNKKKPPNSSSSNSNSNSNRPDTDIDAAAHGDVVTGLVIERLGGCLLVEVDNAAAAAAATPGLPTHAVCYQRSALCDAQIVVGDRVDLSITSSSSSSAAPVPPVAPAEDTTTTAATNGDGDDADDGPVVVSALPTVQGVVLRHHARRNLLQRPAPVGGASAAVFRSKSIAANVDQLAVVIASTPAVPISSVDRLLVAAHAYDMDAVLVVNKVDLDGGQALLDSLAHYASLGYTVLPVSVVTGEGLPELRALLRGKSSVFVGQSGMGKSSLVNVVLPPGAGHLAKVGDLVKNVNLGAHTTSSARLFHLPEGGCVIDSPGIREFGLWTLRDEEIQEGFFEITELAARCKFRNCKHTPDTLGCAVQAGVRDGAVHPTRLASYFSFLQKG